MKLPRQQKLSTSYLGASHLLRWPTLSVQCISPIAAVTFQDDPCPGATLAFGNGSHSIYGMCILLNKSNYHFFSCPIVFAMSFIKS